MNIGSKLIKNKEQRAQISKMEKIFGKRMMKISPIVMVVFYSSGIINKIESIWSIVFVSLVFIMMVGYVVIMGYKLFRYRDSISDDKKSHQ